MTANPTYKNRLLFTIFLFCIFNVIIAQHGKHTGRKSGHTTMKGEIYGKVFDKNTNQPMEYATITLLSTNEDQLINGSITDKNGMFDLIDIPEGQYNLKISFIGFNDQLIENIKISTIKSVYQTEDTYMTASIVLDEVVIDGTSPSISYEIDKKVIDVSRLNTDLAQSAIELLENIPSVSINDNGGLSLRGSSSFTLLIDGKPTAMEASEALATIPASTIQNIEIITNPSAKYDAEGVSGIINIVLKRNKLKGVSLLTNISGGTYENYSGDIAINLRERSHGFNLSASHTNSPRPSHRTTDRTRMIDKISAKIHSDEDHLRYMRHSKFSGEYIFEPNTSHTLIIGGTYTLFDMNTDNYIEYNIYRDNTKIDNYFNKEYNIRNFHTSNANFTYRYNIKREKSHYLELRSVYSSWDGKEFLTTEYLDLDGIQFNGTRRTETGPSDVLRFNLDYSRKLATGKFETGLQFQYGRSSDDSDNYAYNKETKEYIYEELYSKDVTYKRDVSAAYMMYGSKKGKLGYQIGLRLEHTLRNISATHSPDFTSIDRFDLFPSAHLSYKLSETQDLLLNYSRRINRPRSYYFEPFISWYNAYDIASGNPELKPEYIDVIELNWNKKILRKGNLAFELYYRNTKNLIERIEIVYKDDILIRLPINIGKARSIGLQASSSYKILPWWSTDLSFNFYQYDISGKLQDTPYESSSFNWDGRWTNSFPLKMNWRLQFVSNYQSKTTTIQGYRNGFFSFNTSIKKSFQNNKYAFTLQGRNIFGTRVNDMYLNTEGLSVHSVRKPKSPVVMLTFSMRLNNYKSSRRKVDVNDI